MTDKPTLEERAELLVRAVAELPDRTSPDDWPEAMLVTQSELIELSLAALRDAVAERDREWSDTLWPENPEGAGPCEPSEAGAQIKALVAYAVAEERRALREIVAEVRMTAWRNISDADTEAICDSILAALDAREKADA